MDQYSVIANQPIVIDNGSGMVKAGFAGDEVPKCNFRKVFPASKGIFKINGCLSYSLFPK